MTKIIAFYLPQFHAIPENDKWWGEGFTEWTNVKKATPLFTGHHQPRIPLDDNYYRLDNVDTLRWQADLMNQYGVDGMCFYHYWFNGKQLLQTPLELLLEHPEINMPFCISWANEPWTRAWDGGDKEILMAQVYGGEAEWESHFQYLLKAFQDKRYIYVDGKPMVVIYRAGSIPCFDEMVEYWRRRCIESGFPGLHLVISNTVFKDQALCHNYDAAIDFEPMCTIGQHYSRWDILRRRANSALRYLWRWIRSGGKEHLFISMIEYDYLWKKILKRPIRQGVYPGTFVDWDNSPRKGPKRSLILSGYTVEKFANYFALKYQQAQQHGCPFIFINAWNEWAEGTYLEPDCVDLNKKLDAIRAVKSVR